MGIILPFSYFGALVLLLVPLQIQTADLIVNITGVLNDQGKIRAGLFLDPTQFPEGKPIKSVIIDASTKAVEVRFDGLSPGKYAIAIFHDENYNGRVDKNIFGLPKESYGFSNNVRGVLRPPNFEEAAILLETTDKTISVQLR